MKEQLTELYKEREALNSPEATYIGMSERSIRIALEEIEEEMAIFEEENETENNISYKRKRTFASSAYTFDDVPF